MASNMYLSWAAKRQMRHKMLLEDRVDGDRLNRSILAVAGLGAFSILHEEHGLHVWEDPGEKGFDRIKARVFVVSQPMVPGETQELLLAQAEEKLESISGLRNIVRRYRREPSPLVRDSVAGWRTGRLDRVLEGDFDLMVD